MSPELKAQWLAALRSGEYKQGYGNLQLPDGAFCCLGVLCNVYSPDSWRIVEDAPYYYIFNYNENVMFCNGAESSFAKRLGLTKKQQIELINMNDTKRLTFSEIADWIEANL